MKKRSLPKQPKAVGELAEAIFAVRALKRGFRVAKPFGDNAPYDYIVEKDRILQRVQVKSRASACQGRYCFPISTTRNNGRRFGIEETDFFAIYVFPYEVWYLIPVGAFPNRRAFTIQPRRRRGKYERYREAWHLLSQGGHEAEDGRLGRMAGASLFDIVDGWERRVIVAQLEKCGWNQTAAAEQLRVPLTTLNYKIKRLGIERKVSRFRFQALRRSQN